jgi:P2 family phage contractile tail tube protein
MGFPAKLKNFNVFTDGVNQIGVATEVTPPKWAIKMEEWRGGGMLGPVMIDVGLDKLEIDFTLGGLSDAAFRAFGTAAYDGSVLRFAGAYQDDSSGAVRAAEISCAGRYQEIDMGNAKAGGDTEHKYKLACSYVRLDVDGVTWIEVDLVAGIFIVFGTDRYAEIRAALGV